MPDVLVLDASALCKLIRKEPESDQVQAKIRTHLEQGGSVWTDPIAAIEIVTCARRAVEAGEGDLVDLARAVQDALTVVRLVPRGQENNDMSGLIRLALETALTGPDARYVELALGNRLLTFDSKQAAAAKGKGIRLA